VIQTGSFKLVRPLLRFALVLGAVTVLTTIDFRLLQVNSATAALTYLLLTLILATRVGLRESIVASIASTLTYNLYFLPPVGTFTIADPQNWVALCAFMATASIASHLASSAREKTKEAGARQQELQRMYNFSRALMLGDRDRTFLSHATQQIAELFELENVWLYQGTTDLLCKAATGESVLRDSLLRDVASSGIAWRDKGGSALIMPIQLGGHNLGSLGVTGAERLSEVALQSMAQLIAIAWERARAQEVANRLEAARQNEQLKSILLDALAHEFKTPLTSIKAAATTLLSRRLDERECGFLKIIDEEADRLTSLVSDAIELARIGSGPVILQREVFAAEDIIRSALSEVRALFEGWNLELRIEQNLPPVYIDKKLTELAMRQILNNACKYSPAGSAIRISAKLHSEQKSVLLQVANEGPGIPKAEQPLLFEKFYRGREVRNRIAGTGMGLNISREIIQAHGGHIWVESENGKGAQFFVTIPVAEQETQPIEGKKSSVA
jgi:two-component system, OmpR family, sensor histidine kinase KdpD